MKKSAFALIAALLLTCASYAQQNPADAPPSKAAVQRYLDLSKTSDALQRYKDSLKAQQHQQTVIDIGNAGGVVGLDSAPKFDKITDAMIDNISVDVLVQAVIPIYQKRFTKSDMDALISFYSTPAGQKLAKEAPYIGADTVRAMLDIDTKILAQTDQRVHDEIARIKKQNGTNPKNN